MYSTSTMALKGFKYQKCSSFLEIGYQRLFIMHQEARGAPTYLSVGPGLSSPLKRPTSQGSDPYLVVPLCGCRTIQISKHNIMCSFLYNSYNCFTKLVIQHTSILIGMATLTLH